MTCGAESVCDCAILFQCIVHNSLVDGIVVLLPHFEQLGATMSRAEHIVLQSIARYGRVHIGNFSENQQPVVEGLILEHSILIVNEWCNLTNVGTTRLHDMNLAALEIV